MWDAATLICYVLARIQSPVFTFILSLLPPKVLIYEPFFLPSPPASGGDGSQEDSISPCGFANAGAMNLT